MAYIITEQQLILKFDFLPDTKFCLTEKQIDEVEEKITDIVYDAIEDDTYDSIEIDEGMYFEGKYFTDDFTQEIYMRCPICVIGSYFYDPGVHTYPNGDPGYPPYEVFEPTDGWVENYNYKSLMSGLKSLPYISEYIDYSTVEFTIDDDFDINKEVEDIGHEEEW